MNQKKHVVTSGIIQEALRRAFLQVSANGVPSAILEGERTRTVLADNVMTQLDKVMAERESLAQDAAVKLQYVVKGIEDGKFFEEDFGPLLEKIRRGDG